MIGVLVSGARSSRLRCSESSSPVFGVLVSGARSSRLRCSESSSPVSGVLVSCVRSPRLWCPESSSLVSGVLVSGVRSPRLRALKSPLRPPSRRSPRIDDPRRPTEHRRRALGDRFSARGLGRAQVYAVERADRAEPFFERRMHVEVARAGGCHGEVRDEREARALFRNPSPLGDHVMNARAARQDAEQEGEEAFLLVVGEHVRIAGNPREIRDREARGPAASPPPARSLLAELDDREPAPCPASNKTGGLIVSVYGMAHTKMPSGGFSRERRRIGEAQSGGERVPFDPWDPDSSFSRAQSVSSGSRSRRSLAFRARR